MERNPRSSDVNYGVRIPSDNLESWNTRPDNINSVNVEVSSSPRDMNGMAKTEHLRVSAGINIDNGSLGRPKLEANSKSVPDTELSIPQILHLVSSSKFTISLTTLFLSMNLNFWISSKRVIYIS